jgi:hypothetical protein
MSGLLVRSERYWISSPDGLVLGVSKPGAGVVTASGATTQALVPADVCFSPDLSLACAQGAHLPSAIVNCGVELQTTVFRI